jgi:hypothetical protein
MKLRIFAVLSLALALMGCTSVSTSIAAFGLAGVGLQAYCASGGNGCSAPLTAYAQIIITQANEDAGVFGNGQGTLAEIAAITANLNADIQQGQAIPGLTPGQQTELTAILNAASEVLTLVAKLNPPAVSRASAHDVIIHWQVTDRDRAAIAKMQAKIAAAKK